MYDRKERKYDRKESFCITEKNKIEIQNPNNSINPNSSILYQPILFKILINNNITQPLLLDCKSTTLFLIDQFIFSSFFIKYH